MQATKRVTLAGHNYRKKTKTKRLERRLLVFENALQLYVAKIGQILRGSECYTFQIVSGNINGAKAISE